jgi:starch phosphorylase
MVIPGHGTDRVSTLRLWKAARRPRSTCTPSTAATTRAPPSSRTSSRTSPGCCTPTTAPRPGANCACARSTSSPARRSRTSWRATCRNTARWTNLADKVAIHLNDTHPAIGVAELMRLLVDEHGCPGPPPGRSRSAVFSYTNHTLMPEALETWPVALMQHVLPRHLEIIFRINHEFLDRAAHTARATWTSCAAVADRRERRAPRAHGAPVDRGQPPVNGVSALHSTAGETIFADFASLWPSASPT